MKRQDLIGQRVVILGYGREGQASYQALLPVLGADDLSVWAEGVVRLTDQDSKPQPKAIHEKPFDEGLTAFDVAIRSPGIPVTHPALLAFQAHGGRVVTPSSLFLAERPEVPVIGVTGSKGKSTTASLLAHLLSCSGRSVALAGNIGRPLISCLDFKGDLIVAELSSYQLSDLQGSLMLGVITRLFPEHVDWHGSIEAYYQSKLRLFELAKQGVLIQQRDPILVAEVDGDEGVHPVNPWPDSATGNLHRDGARLIEGDGVIFASDQWPLKGQHNLDNAVMALSAFERLGGSVAEGVPYLSTFQPLQHRLQVVHQTQTSDGEIHWVNDSIATTPHATRAALEALVDAPVVLLLGGYERGGDWSVVIEFLRDHPLVGVVTLPDNGPQVAQVLLTADGVAASRIIEAHDLDEAVVAAWQLLNNHRRQHSKHSMTPSVVLLSPGAPSFGHYRDFEERGERFVRAIEAWAAKQG